MDKPLSKEDFEEYGAQSAHFLWERLALELVPEQWSHEKRTAFISGFEIGLHFALQSQMDALGIAQVLNVEVHDGETNAVEGAHQLLRQVHQWREEARLMFSPMEERSDA